MLSLIKNFKIQQVKSTNILIFDLYLFNMDISINIGYKLFKVGVVSLDMIMEGSMS